MLQAIGRSHGAPATDDELRRALDTLAGQGGAKPCHGKVSLAGCIARMLGPSWWRRGVRKSTLLENETNERHAATISRIHQVYVSDHAMVTKARREKANRATLGRLEVVNESGQAFSLAQVSDASISNPKLRRVELMTRARGFDETSGFLGHVGLFMTLTAPSRFHRMTGKRENPKWDGSTPREAQDYLCKQWSKARSAWGRAGLKPYGFRVAEPHHDGCPHWHVLLFVPAEAVGEFDAATLKGSGIVGIVGKYALQESPDEVGAAKYRFTVKRIDPSKGSAAGYIAKYICKNVDGLKEDGTEMGQDFESRKDAASSAARVRVWASLHGIRQFQQIGGPSVTVWREFRRLGPDATLELESFERARAAADRGCWMSFWMLQGGPEAVEGLSRLRPFYVQDETGKYGDEVKRVHGVMDEAGDHVEQTRVHSWTIQVSGLAKVNAIEYQNCVSRQRIARRLRFNRRDGFPGLRRIGEAERTRTSVNNCTVLDFSGVASAPEPKGIATWNGHVERGPVADTQTMALEVAWAERQLEDANLKWTAQCR